MNSPAAREYLSLHVFLADPVRCERYLRERVEPALSRWRASGALERWFFIRYWDGGPHLRIRLAGPQAEDALDTLSEGIDAYHADAPPTRESFYSGHSFDGEPVNVADLPWYGEGAVKRIAYVPELLRYGGAHAMDASEQLFELSSRLALSMCKSTEERRASRPSTALVLMAAAILACGESIGGLGAYFERYGQVWADKVGPAGAGPVAEPPTQEQIDLLLRLREQAAAGWDGKSAHAIWAAGVAQLAGRLRALHRQGRLAMPYYGGPIHNDDMLREAVLEIVGSHVHMLNNRLGIGAAGEFLLARLLANMVNALTEQESMP